MRLHSLATLLVWTLCPAIAGAQSAAFWQHNGMASHGLAAKPSPALQKTLDRLWEAARRYASTVPSFTCDEHLHSEQQSVAGRPIHWVMDTRSDFRVIRSAEGVAGLKEVPREYREQDGRTLPQHQKIVPPYVLNDAFGPAILIYLAPERRSCLNYALSPGRIDFSTVPGMGGHGTCADVAPDAHGYILFDPARNIVSHLERTVPLEAGRQGGFAPFASVDYSPFTPEEMPGQSFQLPSHIVAIKISGQIRYLFNASYRGCRIYHANVVIRDAQGNVIRQETNPHP